MISIICEMNLSKYKRVVFSLTTGRLVAVGLLLLLNGTSQTACASPGTLFVSTAGNDSMATSAADYGTGGEGKSRGR